MFDGDVLEPLNAMNEMIGEFISETMYNVWANCTPKKRQEVEGNYIHQEIGKVVESARTQASYIIPSWYIEKRDNSNTLNNSLQTQFPI